MDIKSFLKKNKLSREDLASKVGVSYITICRWEKKMPTRSSKAIKERIAKVMRGYLLILIFILLPTLCFAGLNFENHNPSLDIARIKPSMDKLYKEVLQATDFKDTNINIYFTESPQELQKIFSQSNAGKVRGGFYSFGQNTIYIYHYNKEILAHELTHALVDNYCGKQLPVQTAELLANAVVKKVIGR